MNYTAQGQYGVPNFQAIWEKYQALRALRERVSRELMSSPSTDQRMPDFADVEKRMIKPIDLELSRLASIAAGHTSTDRRELSHKAQMLRDILNSEDKDIALRLSASLADDVISLS